MSTTPLYLGVALAVGAIVALALTLVTSVRRRRRDLALLKTLGFTRRQLAAVVVVAVDDRGRRSGPSSASRSASSLGRALWDLFARRDPRRARTDRSRAHDRARRGRRARPRQPRRRDSRPDRPRAPRPRCCSAPSSRRTVRSRTRWRPSCRRCSAGCRATSTRRSPRARPTSARERDAADVDRGAPPAAALATPDARGRPARHRRDVAGDRPRARRRLLRRSRTRGARARRGRRRVPRHRAGDRRADPSRRSRRVGSARARPRSAASCAWPIPERWPGEIDPRVIDGAAWAALVFGASETAIALLTSTPGPADTNVLTNAADRGRARRRRPLRGHRPRAHAHDRASQLRRRTSSTRWTSGARGSIRRAGRSTRCTARRRTASPTGGWFLDDDEIGMPFLERVDALGPRVVAAHKGLGGPIPDQSVAAASPRDIGPAAAAFPGINFVVYHSGYERDPDAQEGPYDAAHADSRRRPADQEPRGRRHRRRAPTCTPSSAARGSSCCAGPVEAAHVLGKLLVALGPERIVWGTDSTWYGSPQPLIDAFRAFQIPERHASRARLSAAHRRREGTHPQRERASALRRLRRRRCTPPIATRDRAWVTNASTELHARDRGGRIAAAPTRKRSRSRVDARRSARDRCARSPPGRSSERARRRPRHRSARGLGAASRPIEIGAAASS